MGEVAMPPKQIAVRSGDACCAPVMAEPLASADAELLASAFAALSDPVRLRLFSLIATAGEVCSCDLQGPLAKSQPTISHHTKVLAEAGLIAGRKEGRWTHWSAVPDRLDALSSFLGTRPAGWSRSN
jgi:ArsR family transcriptional regulator